MIIIQDEYYYIDFDAASEAVSGTSFEEKYLDEVKTTEEFDKQDVLLSRTVETNRTFKPREVDGLKYGLLQEFISVVMNTELEFDDALKKHINIEQAPANYIIAFNSLLKLNVLKKI